MKYKPVEGGTITGAPLCRTCRQATYMRGNGAGQMILLCHMTSPAIRMRWEAYECNAWDDKTKPSEHDLYRTAWILRTDEFRKSIGFVSPQEWKKFRRQAGPDYEDEPS